MAGHRAILTLDDGEVRTEIDVVHCCHCGGILGPAEVLLHQRSRGDGSLGWCPRCQAIHHGDRPGCRTCATQEQRCENVEAGRMATDNGQARKLFLTVAFPGK